MKFVLSSTNKAKAEAARSVLEKLYKDFELITIDVNSNVSKTPDNDDEGINGCLNRISEARLQINDADGYIGMEGIITKNAFGTFLCGWAVIELNGKIGLGCSAKVQIPEFISSKVSSFSELSTVVKENYPSDLIEEVSEIGSNGVITNKAYTRVDEFVDALNCAIGFITNSKNLK